MLASEAYELWYNGAGEHEMLAAGKMNSELSHSKELAEYFLNKLNYASGSSASAFALRGQAIKSTLSPSARYVRHIHAAKQREIESKWTRPQLTDDEAADLLFEDKIKKRIEQLPNIFSVDMHVNC